ncbi:MAG TPA: glycosyltransferase [Flavobacteriales bacterium]|nr:glycosyltransferase [Flavobacteriales bacterium]
MKIGIIIGRIGGVDGVALETEKWIQVFQRMGHEVFILSGQFEERELDVMHETLYPVLSFFSTECEWEQDAAFFNPVKDPSQLVEAINSVSDDISNRILSWIDEKEIDVLLSENASALPSHLSMALGIWKAVESCGLPTLTHDHDFHWERGDRYKSPHDDINEMVEKYFPLNLPNVKHAVINLHAQKRLKERYGIESLVVPNVMDFDMPYGFKTEGNKNLLKDLGFTNGAIPVFQITRIVERKGIEVAIELIHKLQDQNVKLVITGNHNDDEGGKYYRQLINQIHDLKLNNQVVFASNLIQNHSWQGHHGSVKYSLSDAYAYANSCTYFSTYEGFGNAFVEAILAKTPVFVNNYEPVFMPDIGSKGFKVVMLEDNKLTDKAIEQMKEIIYNPKLSQEIGAFNFELGKKHFSYDVLQEKLEQLLVL